MRFAPLAVIALPSLLTACSLLTASHSGDEPPHNAASTATTQDIQTRRFKTTDRAKMIRAVITTLQDLSLVIDQADPALSSVSATQPKYPDLRMTATVLQRGDTQTAVRLTVQYGAITAQDPTPYQQFFDALEKTTSLTAVDGQ